MSFFFYVFFGVFGLLAAFFVIRWFRIIVPILLLLFGIWFAYVLWDWNARQHDPKLAAEVQSFRRTAQLYQDRAYQ